jgi:MinD superfamily P-loop ATPase
MPRHSLSLQVCQNFNSTIAVVLCDIPVEIPNMGLLFEVACVLYRNHVVKAALQKVSCASRTT